MEAVVFDGKSLTLKHVTDYPLPKISNDDDVIVKIKYVGICGTDLHIIQGTFPAKKDSPFPLGHEVSGVIHATGKTSTFKIGQKVAIDPNCACQLCEFCRNGSYHNCETAGIKNYIGVFKDGGWAQYCMVPQQQVYALPDEISTEQACLAEPYSCIAHGFDRVAPLKIGQKILIIGAGMIGMLFASALHHQGHREVTVSEKNQNRIDIVKRLDLGFKLVSPEVLAEEKMFFDVIVDCTGVSNVMETAFNYMKPGGKYVIFGCCPPTRETRINPYQVFDKELTIIGVKTNSFSFFTAIAWIKAMGSRYIDYSKLGVKMYRLSEYKSALEDVQAGLITKAVFKVTTEKN